MSESVELRVNTPDFPGRPSVSWWLNRGAKSLRIEPDQAAQLLAEGLPLRCVTFDKDGEERSIKLGKVPVDAR